MGLLYPSEITESYAMAGKVKAERPAPKTLLLAIFAGIFVAAGGAVSNTAAHAVENASLARLISGLIFPFGLGMIMLTGTELFTGNCLLSISVLSRRTTVARMAKNLSLVYLGNCLGAVATAAAAVYMGQLDLSGGALAAYTIKVAAAKCALPFGPALVSAVFCNILVCFAVLCSLSAKDTSGRILGAYLGVSFFVIAGFEHCVANAYYVPAGLLALTVPRYADLAAASGIDTAALTAGRFLLSNMVPVTLGNLLGGVLVGAVMWGCYGQKDAKAAPESGKAGRGISVGP